MSKILNSVLLGTLLINLGSCNSPSEINSVKIAAAANMQFALAALADSFEVNSQIETELIISSSGKLTAQIIEGAPFDIFLSADMKYPQKIFDSGLSKSPPKIYARGQMVLWSKRSRIDLDIQQIIDSNIKHIATANPINAPYGKAAQECLEYYKLSDSISSKIVYGESISQVNQFISTGAAQIGFTSKSVQYAGDNDKTGSWIDIPLKSYAPIYQGAILLDKKSNFHPEAQKFYEFLFSNQGQQILKDFGYLGIRD